MILSSLYGSMTPLRSRVRIRRLFTKEEFGKIDWMICTFLILLQVDFSRYRVLKRGIGVID